MSRTRHPIRPSLLVLIPALGLAPDTLAQECLWSPFAGSGGTQLPSNPITPAVYHAVRHQILTVNYLPSQTLGVWAWDDHGWSSIGGNGPSGRYGQGLAYDSARDRLVLFGGSGATYLADLWEWDGSAWSRIAISGPSPRQSPAMVYDQARHRVVLFGGSSATAGIPVEYSDTWEYDGLTWLPRPVPGPPARDSAASAYDAARGVTVLFGGRNAGFLGDTWEWDGAIWTQVSARGPGPRCNAAMTFDPTTHRSVLYGGVFEPSGVQRRTDTWEYDGAWMLVATGTPPATFTCAMAYDEAISRAVLIRSNSQASDVWLFNSQGNRSAPVLALQPLPVQTAPGAQAVFSVALTGCADASYQWQRNGLPLVGAINIFGATLPTLLISPVTAADYGAYSVVVSNAFGSAASQPALLSAPAFCYANCDSSSTPPILNINDFVCFLNKFAASETYANCDASTSPPTLNILDFICFLNRFAAGCT